VPDISRGELAKALASFAVDVEAGVQSHLAHPRQVADSAMRCIGVMPLADQAEPPRFPITRGHLTTRLSLALEHTPILIKGNHLKPVEGRDDDYFTVLPHDPGALAAELVADVDLQGTGTSVIRQQEPGDDGPLDCCEHCEHGPNDPPHTICCPEGCHAGRPAPCPDCGMVHRPHRQHAGDPLPAPADWREDDESPVEDPEVVAMQDVLDALAPLDEAEVGRVLRWACERHEVRL